MLFHLYNFIQGCEIGTLLGSVLHCSNCEFDLLPSGLLHNNNVHCWACFSHGVVEALEPNFLIVNLGLDVVPLDLTCKAFDLEEFSCWGQSVLLSSGESRQESVWLQSFVELLNSNDTEIFNFKECLVVGNDTSADGVPDCSGTVTVYTLSSFDNSIFSINIGLFSQEGFFDCLGFFSSLFFMSD